MLTSKSMIRCVRAIYRLLFVVLSLGILAGSGYPQTLPSNAEAIDMLERAYIAMNLRKADSPPFHLLAHFRFVRDGNTENGTYDLLWAGPLHYRETFEMEGAQEIDVAIGDKMYVSRTSVAVTLPLHEIRELLKSPMPGNLMVDFEMSKVLSEHAGDALQTCVEVTKREPTTNTQDNGHICFDPATKQITSIRAAGNLANTPTNIRLQAFETLGAKRYPTHLAVTVHGADIEVEVDTLEIVKDFQAGAFTQPPGSSVRDWCLTLAAAPMIEDPSQPYFSQAERKQLSPFFVLVGADGRVKQSDAVRTMDPASKQKILSWLKTARFPIQNCGTEAVEYETFYFPAVKRSF